jgi:hypothetical protein
LHIQGPILQQSYYQCHGIEKHIPEIFINRPVEPECETIGHLKHAGSTAFSWHQSARSSAVSPNNFFVDESVSLNNNPRRLDIVNTARKREEH